MSASDDRNRMIQPADLPQIQESYSRLSNGVPLNWLVTGILALLGLQTTSLLLFLDMSRLLTAASWVGLALLIWSVHKNLSRHSDDDLRIPWRVLLVCIVFSMSLFVLGGEGRFLYANTDWQVRGTLLHDLARYPWPFAYTDASKGAMILRAPLGMYLLPAGIAKLTGENSSDILLLLENSALLSMVLAAGSIFFRRIRDKWIALVIFFGFSGMDWIGRLLINKPLDRHLEQWSTLQYSAHITQVYWVPQHCLAGWIGALFYLLWRKNQVSLAVFGSIVPLLAFLSPFALIGIIPFALHAGVSALWQRKIFPVDVVLPLLAGLLAIPALLFLTANSGSVGSRASFPEPEVYGASLLLEVGLPLIAIFLCRKAHVFGYATSILMLAALLLIPLGHVGDGADFIMRASIPSLAILAVLMAHLLSQPVETRNQRLAVGLIGTALLLGLPTPITETIRAIRFPPAPRPLCNFFGMLPGGSVTYNIPAKDLPALIRPHMIPIVKSGDAKHCWDGPWPPGQTVGLFDPIPQVPAQTYK